MPRTWSHESPVRRHPDAVWRSFADELALLDPALRHLSSLNEVAARIWELADGRPLGGLIEQLLNEFEVERNQLDRDVRTFLDELHRRGLLAE